MTERTINGIDPHKENWTAVAVDHRGHKLAALRVPVSVVGYRRLRPLAGKYPGTRVVDRRSLWAGSPADWVTR